MKTEEMIKDLTNEEQGNLIKLDSLLRMKAFREKLKISPVETLRKEGFDIPNNAKFVFTDDDTKIDNDNGKDGIYYINLKSYEGGYVDTEDFKSVAGGAGVPIAEAKQIAGILNKVGGVMGILMEKYGVKTDYSYLNKNKQ